MKENRYLAHALLRQLRQPGALCDFDFCELKESQQRPQAQWECCVLQNTLADILTGETILISGNDLESVHQAIWDEACKTQDTFGTQCYLTTYCCETCAEAMVISHTNQRQSTQFAFTLARTSHCALLLMSERSSQLPLVLPIPANTPATDLLPFLNIRSISR